MALEVSSVLIRVFQSPDLFHKVAIFFTLSEFIDEPSFKDILHPIIFLNQLMELFSADLGIQMFEFVQFFDELSCTVRYIS